MRIFPRGPAFIGANLARAALADPFFTEVRVVDFSTGALSNLDGLDVDLVVELA